VLYEALTGRKVFQGDTPVATGLMHATAPAPSLPVGVSRADPQLASLVMRMLAKDPAARPTAATIESRLEMSGPVASEATQRLRPATADGTVPTAVAPVAFGADTQRTVALPPASTPSSAWSSIGDRNRRVGLIAVAVLLLLGVVGAFALIQSGGDPPATPPGGAAPTARATTVAGSGVALTAALAVPNLEGQSVAAATAQLAEQGLKLLVTGAAPSPAASGLITTQVPAAETPITSGSTVSVTLSSGPGDTTKKKPKKPKKGKG
jgi:serine/threonine-protein kinase